MSSQSPASVLYSSDGIELAVPNGSPVPAGTRAILISGKDGYTGNAAYAPSTPFGVIGSASMANSFPVLSNVTVTVSDSLFVTTNFFGTQEIALVVNVGTVTGGGTITFTVQEVDPGDGVTVYGSSASTSAIAAAGVSTAVLNLTTSSSVKVSWTVASTFSATIYATLVSKATPSVQAISGSITATNPSVGTDGAAAVASDTQVGGIVSASAPTYTAGNLNALSLTTSGDLRVVANQGTSPWVTSVSNTVTVTGTVTANQGTSPWIVAGGGTAGTPASGVVTIQGIAGMTHLSDDGYAFATAAAPTYTGSTWNPLSVDLSGNLRVIAAQGTTPWTVVSNKAGTSSVTSVASSATNVTLLAANANRQFASIFNESTKTVYIKLGTTASNTSYSILLMPNSYWEVPVDYTGQIDAIWSAANGNARITELTP